MPRRLGKKRSADRDPSDVRTRRTTKRPKRNKSPVDEDVGEFIVVDTGIVEDTGTAWDTERIGETVTGGDTGIVEDNGTVDESRTIKDTVTVEDENPKTKSAFVGIDTTLEASDALFVLDSAPDVAKKERNQLQNSMSLYIPSPDGESQQSRITRPSINKHQSNTATERSSGLIRNATWSPPPGDAPDDGQRPPKSARLLSSSQELSPPTCPALTHCHLNPNALPVRDMEQRANELSARRKTNKPPQSTPMAEGDHFSSKFGISGDSIGRQNSQPASINNPPPHHTGVLCPGTVGNDEVSTRSRTQDSDHPGDPQAFLHVPCQASQQHIGVGEPWTGSLTSHQDQPAQRLPKSRPEGVSKASPSQGFPPVNPSKVQPSSIGMTSTDNSICQAARLVRQPLLERHPHRSLSVSNVLGPALSLSPTPSNLSAPGTSYIRHLHALPLESSVTPLIKPSNSPQPQLPAINKRILSTADERRFYLFSTHAIIVLRLEDLSTGEYPASVMIWRTLQSFKKWYMTETSSAEIPVLKFKLLDDSGKLDKEFLLPDGDLQRFQTLKQDIWDSFWFLVSMNSGAVSLRILITPLPLDDKAASHSSQAPRWDGGNATASRILASPLPASSLENNFRVVADHLLPATTVSRRHYGCPSPYPPPSTLDNDDTTTPQGRSIPAQVNLVTGQTLESNKDPSPSFHNSMWMNVITGDSETSRTINDKKKLRDMAAEFIAGREDVELEEDETTGGRKRVYPDACGAVVDKSSAKGLVAITDQGFSVQQVDTGQGLIGEPYTEMTIGVGQTCVIHGSSTVLYYKPRKISASNHAQPFQSRGATQPRGSSIYERVKLASLPPEIAVRLQMDELGKFGAPYEFSVWESKIKTTEFFAWFGRQTGRGGVKGPQILTFTLKDAMPDRKSRDIAILGEDDFHWMRKYIITEFEKAKWFMPGLKDFTVLVTDPGWVSHGRSR